jgi:hypothetical protein
MGLNCQKSGPMGKGRLWRALIFPQLELRGFQGSMMIFMLHMLHLVHLGSTE